jgi:hypothetical protein
LQRNTMLILHTRTNHLTRSVETHFSGLRTSRKPLDPPAAELRAFTSTDRTYRLTPYHDISQPNIQNPENLEIQKPDRSARPEREGVALMRAVTRNFSMHKSLRQRSFTFVPTTIN